MTDISLMQTAIARGCAFLEDRQLPSGQVPVEVSADHEHGGAWVADPTVFATAVVMLCLEGVADRSALAVTCRGAEFLRREMHKSGVWRFWTNEHRWGSVVPYDSDDTACAAAALRGHGGAPAGAARHVLVNRDREGLFYTWLVPHWGVWPRDLSYWRCALTAWRAPRQRFGFWRFNQADPRDIDAVVCANVLLLLGERPETAATVEYLVGIVHARNEARCDKWYFRPLAVHHAIARAAAAGVAGLFDVRHRAVARILGQRQDDGSFGDDELDTALALCALADWRHDGPEREQGAMWLLAAQQEDGAWPRAAYYGGGFRDRIRWGSAELTTAFCVSALSSLLSLSSDLPVLA